MTQEITACPIPFNTTCFTIENVFTPTECQELISLMIPEPLKINAKKQGENGEETGEILRIVERTSLRDETLANNLYTHVSSICPSTWQVNEEDVHLGPFAQGEWEIDGVDPRISLYRYEAGGVFTKHRDGPTYYSVDKRSFFTCLIYLNVDYVGGNTTVFSDDLAELFPIQPTVGGVFVMLQRVLHEGSHVIDGVKWAMRCDVLYRRKEGSRTAEEFVMGLSKEEQAKKWLELGQVLEGSGMVNESVKYYMKAHKLDPNLEM